VPQAGFLFSIAGLSFTLVGFSGLIAALGRDGQRTSLLVYRLRQIPEMALASALIALISIPLVDLAGSPMLAIRIASGLAFAFTAGHVGLLIVRMRSQTVQLRPSNWVLAAIIDVGVLAVAVLGITTAEASVYEWLLVLLVTRPAIAFVIALNDVMSR